MALVVGLRIIQNKRTNHFSCIFSVHTILAFRVYFEGFLTANLNSLIRSALLKTFLALIHDIYLFPDGEIRNVRQTWNFILCLNSNILSAQMQMSRNGFDCHFTLIMHRNLWEIMIKLSWYLSKWMSVIDSFYTTKLKFVFFFSKRRLGRESNFSFKITDILLIYFMPKIKMSRKSLDRVLVTIKMCKRSKEHISIYIFLNKCHLSSPFIPPTWFFLKAHIFTFLRTDGNIFDCMTPMTVCFVLFFLA